MKKTTIIKGFAALGAVVLLVLFVNAVTPIVNQYFDQQQEASDLRERVTGDEQAQDNYEWFKTQRQKIDAMKEKIRIQRDQIRNWKKVNGDNADEWNRQQTKQYNRMVNALTGYRTQYQNLVADYNARMNMETRNLYNNSLPLEMEDKFWTGDLIP